VAGNKIESRWNVCRSIKVLRRSDGVADYDEIEAAALQYVRKVSGFRQPSKANKEVFDAAVEEVTAASRRLLESLSVRTPART
jgi:hypothetical protein